MPVFDYVARDNKDAPREGRVEADSAQGAHRKLTLQGLKVVRLVPTTGPTRSEPLEPTPEPSRPRSPWPAVLLVLLAGVAWWAWARPAAAPSPPAVAPQASVSTFKTPAERPTPVEAAPAPPQPVAATRGSLKRTASGRYEAAKPSTVEAALLKAAQKTQGKGEDKPRLEPVAPQAGGDLDSLVDP